nr:unnamed protein product [Callosobruchus chinensis]
MDNEQILEFIEDYRSYQCLWDIHSKFYTNKNKRNDAYRELSEKYNINEKAVKNKIKSLRSYFSKEHQKVTEMKSGSGSDSKYDSTWFAYRQLLFIADSVTPRQTKDSIWDDNPATSSADEKNTESTQNDNEVRKIQ